MANIADLKLIQIPEFPKTDTLVGSGPEYVVLTKADGVTYSMLSSDFKAFLGTVQVQAPKALTPTDPAPTLDGVYEPTIEGAYANAGGLERLSTDGYVRFIKNGATWVKVNTPMPEPDLSGLVEKTDIVDNLDTNDAEKPLSAKQGVAIKPRILPEGQEFVNIDRPDLEGLFDVLNINEDNLLLNDLRKRVRVGIVDRPDMKIVFVDKDGKIIYTPSEVGSSGGGAVQNDTMEYIKKLYNPPLQESFTITDPHLIDYDILIDKWDALIADNPTNPELQPYVTKIEKGRTSTKDMPIYKYIFSPPNPKHKILVIAGTHASEKVYINQLFLFMETVMTKWADDPVVEWLRWNVEFHIFPCLSPSSITGYTPGSTGGRRIHETDDIPVSWTKSGTTVTVTFNLADFPDTGGRLDGATYFSGEGIVNKLDVSLFESSDPIALPDEGYTLKSVINGRTITVEAAAGGASSGTAKMYIGTDPNRNTNADGYPGWYNYDSTVTVSKPRYSNDRTPSSNNNKGTKPFSLTETIMIKNDLDTELYDYMLDLHAGAGKNYLKYSEGTVIEGIGEALNNIKKLQGQFSMASFSLIGSISSLSPQIPVYNSIQNKKKGYIIEWTQTTENDAKESTDSLRWLFICITELLKLKK